MTAARQSCPHCKASFQPAGDAPATQCPRCGRSLLAATSAGEAKWYYARDDQKIGPITSARLKELASSGVLSPTDMVVRPGMQEWVPASTIKGLFADHPPPPPPPPSTAVASPTIAPAPGSHFVPHRQTQQVAWELIISVAALVVITVVYVLLARRGPPSPGGFVGHSLGIIGFLLMLSTETLYTLRKRIRAFTFGQMNTWLQIHIVTGIVGPYLVLLHAGWKFQGLAGVLTLLTVVMVVSGLIGRYIYTAVPRTLDGVEVAVRDLEEQIASADRQLQVLGAENPGTAADAESREKGWMLVFGRGLLRWRQKRRLRQATMDPSKAGRTKAAQLERLLAERYRLQLQIQSLAATRRLLALWHVIHLPLGAVVFVLAFVHIGAALYYSTFLR